MAAHALPLPAVDHDPAWQATQPVATPLEYTTVPSNPAAQLHDPAVPVKPVAVQTIAAHELPLPAVDHLSAGQAIQPDVAPLEYTTVPSNPAAQVHDPAVPAKPVPVHAMAAHALPLPAVDHDPAWQATQPVAAPLEYTTVPSNPAAQLHDPAVPVKPAPVQTIAAHELPLPAVDHLSAGQAIQPDVAPLEYTTVPSNPAAQVHDPAVPAKPVAEQTIAVHAAALTPANVPPTPEQVTAPPPE